MATKTVYTTATYKLILDFDANGGSTVPATVTATKTSAQSVCDVSATIPATLPTWTGHDFLGYATAANGPVTYYPGDTIKKRFSRNATWYNNTYETDANGNYVVVKHYYSYDQTETINLYAIWEATGSTVSTTDGTLGTQQTLTVTPLDPSYTHTLKYDFAGQSGTIATGVSTTANWTPPLSLAEYLTDATSGPCVLTCESYDADSVLVGTTQTTITLSIPSNVKCTIASVALAETVAGIASKFGGYVQNKSQISVTGTFNSGAGSPAYGATVAAVSITINGQTLNSNGAVTNLLTQSGTNSYTLTITDTRGRTDSYTSTFNVLAYNSPSVSMTAERDGTTNTTINVAYSWNIAACSDLNDKAITITYEDEGGNSTDIPITPGTYSGNSTYAITGTDVSLAYTVTVEVEDYFTSVTNTAAVAPAGNRIVHISADDKTIALHGANPNDGSDHEYFPIKFHDTVIIGGRELYKSLWTGTWSTGNITVDGLSNYTFFILHTAVKSSHTPFGTAIFASLVLANGTVYFRGIGGYAYNSSAFTGSYFGATAVGDTLTFGHCFGMASDGSVSQHEIIEIIGII